MIRIVDATLSDSKIITELGKITFLEAHSKSAPVEDIEAYVNKNFIVEVFESQFNDCKAVFKILYYNDMPVGYSKIIFDVENSNIAIKKITKLERLYLLEAYHNLKLGFELFNHNLNISKNKKQLGFWLNVWTENHKAINFYKKLGFKIVGNYQFQISETHSNPNYQMFLKF